MASSHKWATTWGTALASLTAVETQLATYLPRSIPPRSVPVDKYPVRHVAQSGLMTGDGMPRLYWEFDLFTRGALNYIVDTYLTVSSARVVSRKMTIYTRIDEAIGGVYFARFNAYLTLPQPGVDYTPRAGYYENFRLPFVLVEQLVEP